MQTGNQLHQLYATILLFCNPSSPLNLWTEFKVHSCDDLRYQIQHNFANFIDGEITENNIYDYGLCLIDQILKKSGKSLTNFPDLPAVTGAWLEIEGNQLILNRETIMLMKL